jgi:multidrug efflux pump subunit AcrA (membrane-fusion protein)
MPVTLATPSGQAVKGTVRVVAPTVDPTTRNGQVLIDLQAGSDARPGMFARGEIDVGQAGGWTLPQTAVMLRDGFSHVMRVGPDARVSLAKVTLGRRNGDRIEIAGGLPNDARVVASGGAFLADGDLVKIVEAPR